jgi:hypothetical protein
MSDLAKCSLPERSKAIAYVPASRFAKWCGRATFPGLDGGCGVPEYLPTTTEQTPPTQLTGGATIVSGFRPRGGVFLIRRRADPVVA